MLKLDPIFSVPALSRWLPFLASGMTGFAVAVLYYSSDFHEVSGACLSAALLWIAVAHVQNIMEIPLASNTRPHVTGETETEAEANEESHA